MLASARISLIWIAQGLDGERAEEARLKAVEVLALLGGGSDLAEVVHITWKTAPNRREEMSEGSEPAAGRSSQDDLRLGIGETSGIVD